MNHGLNGQTLVLDSVANGPTIAPMIVSDSSRLLKEYRELAACEIRLRDPSWRCAGAEFAHNTAVRRNSLHWLALVPATVL